VGCSLPTKDFSLSAILSLVLKRVSRVDHKDNEKQKLNA
jgi:hypothetical protein